MGMGIWEQLITNVSESYSRGILEGPYLGVAINDLSLPDSEGKIIQKGLDLDMFRPLAQAVVFAAGRGLEGRSILRLILNRRSQYLVIPELRLSLEENMQGVLDGEVDPNRVKPYADTLSALTNAGMILTNRAGQLLSRTEGRLSLLRS